eukprot:1160963-Pelagomonas_calceolata.AAC.21
MWSTETKAGGSPLWTCQAKKEATLIPQPLDDRCNDHHANTMIASLHSAMIITQTPRFPHYTV